MSDLQTLDVNVCGAASAVHADFGDAALVMIGKLRVIVREESQGLWFAQGLEIDYAADGASLEDVKTTFARGLALTIDENLRVYGSLRNMLRTAPADIWNDFLTAAAEQQFQLDHSSVHVRGMELQFLKAA
jgi:hypothetical protein